MLEARSSAINEVERFKKGKDDLKINTVEWANSGPNKGYSAPRFAKVVVTLL